ncbi:hypothetical protein ATY81_16385 [Rhizobium sp. R72]|nr:hypothetical protein ATY81_16385 [Rhizobium sp. R72]OWV92946.1 hypothetical protein ATY80_16385 [Rhizobium sp. R711]
MSFTNDAKTATEVLAALLFGELVLITRGRPVIVLVDILNCFMIAGHRMVVAGHSVLFVLASGNR